MVDRRLNWLSLGALLLLGMLYGFHAAGVGMLGPDEPRYASIGRTMAETGDWVTPVLWGQPWFEKPPLTYWLVGAGVKLGLPGEEAARWPIAALSAGFLVLFYLQLAPFFGRMAAWLAAALLGTTGGWVAYSSLAATDLPLSATFGAAMVLGFTGLERDDPRRMRWAGVALGLAILAKSLVPIALVLPLLWYGWRKWRSMVLPGLLALAVAAPWYAVMMIRFGHAFWDELIIKHQFSRLTSDALQHVQPWWFYLPVLIAGLLPWAPLAAGLQPRVLWLNKRTRFFVLWLVWGLVVFSVSRNKLPGYLLPLLPAAAVLLAVSWDQTARWRNALAGSVFLVCLFPPVTGLLPEALLHGLRRTAIPAIPWDSVAIAVVLALFVYVLERFWRRAAAAAFAVTVISAGFVYVKSSAWPMLDRLTTARPLWRAVEPRVGETCVAELDRALRYGLNFYSRIPLPDCADEERPFQIVQEPDQTPVVIRGGNFGRPLFAPVQAPEPPSPASGQPGTDRPSRP